MSVLSTVAALFEASSKRKARTFLGKLETKEHFIAKENSFVALFWITMETSFSAIFSLFLIFTKKTIFYDSEQKMIEQNKRLKQMVEKE